MFFRGACRDDADWTNAFDTGDAGVTGDAATDAADAD
jgi:hypothetical protein